MGQCPLTLLHAILPSQTQEHLPAQGLPLAAIPILTIPTLPVLLHHFSGITCLEELKQHISVQAPLKAQGE